MSEQTRLPSGAWNLPPGCTLRDIEGEPECNHQYPGGGDSFRQIGYRMDVDGEGTDSAVFRCELCGEDQEREMRP